MVGNYLKRLETKMGGISLESGHKIAYDNG